MVINIIYWYYNQTLYLKLLRDKFNQKKIQIVYGYTYF